jgi:hypothetical protein
VTDLKRFQVVPINKTSRPRHAENPSKQQEGAEDDCATQQIKPEIDEKQPKRSKLETKVRPDGTLFFDLHCREVIPWRLLSCLTNWNAPWRKYTSSQSLGKARGASISSMLLDIGGNPSVAAFRMVGRNLAAGGDITCARFQNTCLDSSTNPNLWLADDRKI